MALSLVDLILTTCRDLSGNWVRSGLTTLGIFMGVAAVNATLNIDAITQTILQEKIARRDQPFITPWIYDPTYTNPTPTLSEADMAKLQQEIPGILSISQTNWLGISQVQYLDTVVNSVNAAGVSASYQQTTGRQIIAGRFFQNADFEEYRPVAIVDEVLAQQLFQDKDAISKRIFVDGIRLTVIGVSESKNNWDREEPEGVLWVPKTYGDVISGGYSWGNVQIALRQLRDYESVQEQVKDHLKRLYPGFSVEVWSNAEDLYKEDQQQRISTLILKIIGILALIIGGVGIANITVAAIMERTREIGLRRAIGATDLEIMAQFITEAALLSLIGGGAAVTTVHFLTQTATTTLFEAPYEFQVRDALLSMGSAFAVGVGASLLPALRITQIDVVQALRGE